MSIKRRTKRHTSGKRLRRVFVDPPAGWHHNCMGGVGGKEARAILRAANFNVRGYHVNGWAVPPEQGVAARSLLTQHGFIV